MMEEQNEHSRTEPVRVLIADDSAFLRRALTRLLNADPGFTVVGTACDGAEAIEKIKALRPEVVTLDIEMPVVDGHTAIGRILRECSGGTEADAGAPAIIVFSVLTAARSHDALRALREGASDVVSKDTPGPELLERIRAIAAARRRVPEQSSVSVEQAAIAGASIRRMRAASLVLAGRTIRCVVIGASTGGPPVLEGILSGLPPGLPFPIVIAQHMPETFTKAMSERLDRVCEFPVLHGRQGMALESGSAYIIPGGMHGRVRALGGGSARLEVSEEPRGLLYRPSVDELLGSAAKCFGREAMGIVLTGIGEDGKQGGGAILAAGGLLIAQDRESSVVYGMPRVAAEIGAASLVPEAITRMLIRAGGERARARAA